MIGLIARREVQERLRAKSYWLMTALVAVIILAVGIIANVAGGEDTKSSSVAVSEPVPAGFSDRLSALGSAVGHEVTTSETEADAARQEVENDDVDAAVLGANGEVLYADDVDVELQSLIQQAWSQTATEAALVDAGVDDETAASAASPEALTATTLEEDDDNELGLLSGTAASVLLFLSLQIFGNYALAGVAEEKSSAVVEMLLVRVRADQLLAGKLIGIGVAALVQFAVMIVAGLVALRVSGVDVPAEVWSAIPMTLVWFLGGFAFYATLYALAGSLVSRQEDAQAAAAPIATVLISAYVMIYIFGYTPEATISRVLSVLPPTAPFLMPMRMAAGAASVAEVCLAIVLLFASTILIWRMAARIYENVLLRRGTRIPWREALSLARSSS